MRFDFCADLGRKAGLDHDVGGGSRARGRRRRLCSIEEGDLRGGVEGARGGGGVGADAGERKLGGRGRGRGGCDNCMTRERGVKTFVEVLHRRRRRRGQRLGRRRGEKGESVERENRAKVAGLAKEMIEEKKEREPIRPPNSRPTPHTHSRF